jgi:prevent-host-death family protein
MSFDRRKGVQTVKIESLRDVKANLSKIVKKLPADRSVVITKNGRPCAVLFPVTEETDIAAQCWRGRTAPSYRNLSDCVP